VNAGIKLLDKYAKSCSIAQDKDLAAKLRVTKAAVSGWRHGKSHPDAESIAKMCEATGEPLAHWLPLIEADRARTPEGRKVWLRLAHLATAATVVLSVLSVGNWWAQKDSNLQPRDYESPALTVEL
jgi:transcriptional regulator with XRE-family HTH domain